MLFPLPFSLFASKCCAANGPSQLVIPLPLLATKFVQPLRVDGAEFFRRWKGLEGKEKQVVFKLASNPLDASMVEQVIAQGMKFALLQGVDPNTANFVASGWLATKGDSQPSLILSFLQSRPCASLDDGQHFF